MSFLKVNFIQIYFALFIFIFHIVIINHKNSKLDQILLNLLEIGRLVRNRLEKFDLWVQFRVNFGSNFRANLRALQVRLWLL